MRIFSIQGTKVTELAPSSAVNPFETLSLPASGYLWLSCTRSEFELHLSAIQATLHRLCSLQLVDLHVSDLLNSQLPSRYDFTSLYDVLVFRRLAAGKADKTDKSAPTEKNLTPTRQSGPPILRRIDTSPVGFVVLDKLLLSVHPQDCAVRDSYLDRLLTANGNTSAAAGSAHPSADSPSTGARGIPTSPADLMLRVLNHMVDGFLALRRELTHQLDHWQVELLNPRTRFNNWGALLDARLALHHLDEICEDQRAAVQDWIEALKTWQQAQHIEREGGFNRLNECISQCTICVHSAPHQTLHHTGNPHGSDVNHDTDSGHPEMNFNGFYTVHLGLTKQTWNQVVHRTHGDQANPTQSA